MKKVFLYIQEIKSQKDLILLTEKIIDKFGQAIIAEVSVKKNYKNQIIWQLEFLGGFPSRSIEEYSFNETKSHFHLVLDKLIQSEISMLYKLDTLSSLKSILREVAANYENEFFPGNIVTAIRTIRPKIIREESWNPINGKIQQEPEFFEKYFSGFRNKSIVIPQTLVPVQIYNELIRYKSALVELFQQLLKKVENCQRLLISSGTSQHQFPFLFEGNLTLIVAHAMMLHGSGNLKMNDGQPIEPKKFIKRYLYLFGIKDAGINRAIQNILESSLENRIENQLMVSLQKASQHFLQ